MPMSMTRPDPLTGMGRDERAAQILDDDDVDRLIAQAEDGDDGDEDEEDGDGDEDEET